MKHFEVAKKFLDLLRTATSIDCAGMALSGLTMTRIVILAKG